jgi:very-short-patch-repair endonuclease
MTGGVKYRESELPEPPPGYGAGAAPGRKCISVIGIDRYRRWPALNNAVSDAEGVLAAFERLGFVPVVAPLLNDRATFEAIHCLPDRLKPELGWNDSLVIFFAGHGHTARIEFPYGPPISKGYLIPVDADRASAPRSDDREHTWHRIGHWLTTITELPPRHILVILDSCHSGIALEHSTAHRGVGVRDERSPVQARERRGRWVLASARGEELAMDSGPFRGHSAFTGYLIEMLSGGPDIEHTASTVSVEQLADYVQTQVLDHSSSRQEPVLGHLEFHDRGKMVLSLQQARAITQPNRSGSATDRPEADTLGPHRSADRIADRAEPTTPHPPRDPDAFPDRTEGWALDPPVAAALDRQGEERRLGAHVLTVVSGDAMAAQTSWGTWAARHGYLTLATQSVGLDAVVADLLAQTPWLRCVPEARNRLAAAARIDVASVDASLDARAMRDQRTWVDDVAPSDAHAQVGGWILSSLRRATACIPDLAAAPVKPAELLAVACDLASPTAVLLFHPTPDERWLERAIVTAAELIPYLPAHSVAVTAPEELVSKVLGDRRRGSAFTMARQGWVRVESHARRIPGRARRSTMRVLFDALARDPRTRGRFELDGKVPTADGPMIDVALVAHKARIAVELDAWYHFHDPEGYQRDRVQDARLQRAGYFVLRFPAEDVDDRLVSTIEQLAIALAGRRAVRALP